MQTIRTICCKLTPTPLQASAIDATLGAFAGACNRIAGVCRDIDSTNRFGVHKVCYGAIREEFGMVANLTIRAIARTCTTLKVPGKEDSTFDPTSIDYDQRTFSFQESDWAFSLSLLGGRQRFTACLGDFQREALTGKHPTSATLVRRHDGQYFLHIQIKEDAPEPVKPADVLGVDFGIINLAVDSDGEVFSGDRVEAIRQKYNARRRGLNRCGSKSARRRLRKIRKKEARFRADQNHIISKRLVDKAKGTGRAIAVEDLSGIGNRTTARKGQRNRMKGWAFYQLRTFVTYKAQRAGVLLAAVDPRNTSRTCSVCGHCERANRKSRDQFVCKACGHESSADLNAARNIRTIGLPSCSLMAGAVDAGRQNPAEAACKPPASAVGS